MGGHLEGKRPSESPQDRLFKRGPGALSDVELIALLVFGGCCEYEVLDQVEQLLEYGGGLTGLSRMDTEDLIAILGVTPARAAALVAAMELERRMGKPEIEKEKMPELDHPTLTCGYLVKQFENDGRELYGLLSLDRRHRLIRQHLSDTAETEAEYCWFHDGDVDKRELIKQALFDNAFGIILFRNHSSPRIALLQPDYALARQLVIYGRNIGVPLLDYVVIRYPRCASMRSEAPVILNKYGDSVGGTIWIA